MAMGEWADFFVAEVGAAAALAGLLFVGVSLNLPKVLKLGGLPNRALQALAQLIAVLLVSSLMLMPGQSTTAIGLEILAIGLAGFVGGTALGAQSFRQTDAAFRAISLWNIALFEAAILPYIIGGAIVFSGNGDGLYWLAVGICLSFVKAIADAWVLLVEINR